MYKRRIIAFMIIAGVMLLTLVGRLAHLQIVQVNEHREQWEQSMRREQSLPAPRGRIMDAKGKILAVDLPCKDFCFDYRLLVKDPQWERSQVSRLRRENDLTHDEAKAMFDHQLRQTWELAEKLAAATNSDLDEKVRDVVQAVQRVKHAVARRTGRRNIIVAEERRMHPVVETLDDETAIFAESQIAQGNTIGAAVRPGNKRFYPYGDIACHVIGLTGPVTAEQLEKINTDNGDDTTTRDDYRSGDIIGISGLERMCEPILRGRRGRIVQAGGWRKPLQIEHVPAQRGTDVHLTLDIALQRELAELIKRSGYTGSAVVISIERNEVLAMVSVPTYDLNTYYSEYTQLLADDVNLPLTHRAIRQKVQPGSIIKPFVALEGMAEGIITRHSTYECNGHLYPDDPNHWRCTGRHGAIDLGPSLARSCNIYYFRLGSALGAPRMCQLFRRLGLNSPTGLGLFEEVRGHVPSDEWLSRPRNRPLLKAEASQMAIGQGQLLVTPLAIANALAAIGRDGKLMPPMLALEVPPKGDEVELGFSPGAISAVLEGMHDAVHRQGGTAYRAFHPPGWRDIGVELSGKTGTAQAPPLRVDSNRNGRIDGDDVIVKQGNIAWFAAIAPMRKPTIAFVIGLEYVTDGGGGSVAGPIGRDLIRILREMNYLQ